eukprot:3232014-Rhodomonas_salina.3
MTSDAEGVCCSSCAIKSGMLGIFSKDLMGKLSPKIWEAVNFPPETETECVGRLVCASARYKALLASVGTSRDGACRKPKVSKDHSTKLHTMSSGAYGGFKPARATW